MQFWVVLDEISSQEYQVFAGVPEGSIFGSTLFLLYINDLPNNVISNIAICADDIILYLKCGQASDLRQHLQWASELESDLRECEQKQKKCLVDFNAAKTQMVSFCLFSKTGTILVKMDETVLDEKSFFKMLGLTFSSKLDSSSYIISNARTVWNTVVISRLVVVVDSGIVGQTTKMDRQNCWSFTCCLS